MIKYLPFIFAALCVDALQAALSWAFITLGAGLQALTPVGVAIAGTGAGAAYCWAKAGTTIQGVIDAAKCGAAGGIVGAGVSTLGLPLGVGAGMISDFCISCTFGIMLIAALWWFGLFYPKHVMSGGIFELMPGFDALPGWTIMTVLCVLRKMKEDRQLTGKASTTFATILSPQTTVGAMFRGVKTIQQRNVATMRTSGQTTDAQIRADRAASRQELKKNLAHIDGITPQPKTANGLRTRTTYAV